MLFFFSGCLNSRPAYRTIYLNDGRKANLIACIQDDNCQFLMGDICGSAGYYVKEKYIENNIIYYIFWCRDR